MKRLGYWIQMKYSEFSWLVVPRWIDGWMMMDHVEVNWGESRGFGRCVYRFSGR